MSVTVTRGIIAASLKHQTRAWRALRDLKQHLWARQTHGGARGIAKRGGGIIKYRKR